MQKIVIFVEGLTESLFINQILQLTFNYNDFSAQFVNIGSPSAPSPHDYDNPNSKLHFLVIDVGGDGSVLSSIKDREAKILSDGNTKIIGLQDMYCLEYDGRSNHKIDTKLNLEFIKSANEIISTLSKPRLIKYCFAIMEIEGWILSMPALIHSIHQSLTDELINRTLGFKLENIDPQLELFKPSLTLVSLYKSVNLNYNKSFHCLSSLMNKIIKQHIDALVSSNKSASFKEFRNEIIRGNRKYLYR